MEKKIKWEKPILKDLSSNVTIGACTYGNEFVPVSTCSNTGSSATGNCFNGVAALQFCSNTGSGPGIV